MGNNKRTHHSHRSDPIRLDKPFEADGEFWLKSEPDSQRIRGVLRYEPSGTLQLVACAAILERDPRAVWTHAHAPEPCAIEGELVGGQGVLLTRCNATNTTVMISGGVAPPQTISVGSAMITQWRSAPVVDSTESAELVLRGLTDWRGGAVWTGPELKPDSPFYLGRTLPETIEIDLPQQGWRFCIHSSWRARSCPDGMKVTFPTHLQVTAAAQADSETLFRALWQFRALLYLMAGHPLDEAERGFFINDCESEGAHERRVSVLYSRRRSRSISKPPDHEHFMPLPYRLVADRFKTMVQKWFALPLSAQTAARLLLSSAVTDPPPVELRFAATMQIVETYERSHPQDPIDDEYRTTVLPKIMDAIRDVGPAIRQPLEQKLSYALQRSLLQRLTRLLDRLPEPVQIAIAGPVKDRKRSLRRIIDARDAITHGVFHEVRLAKKLPESVELFHLAERFQILVIANLYLDVGIELDELAIVLRRRQAWEQYFPPPA